MSRVCKKIFKIAGVFDDNVVYSLHEVLICSTTLCYYSKEFVEQGG